MTHPRPRPQIGTPWRSARGPHRGVGRPPGAPGRGDPVSRGALATSTTAGSLPPAARAGSPPGARGRSPPAPELPSGRAGPPGRRRRRAGPAPAARRGGPHSPPTSERNGASTSVRPDILSSAVWPIGVRRCFSRTKVLTRHKRQMTLCRLPPISGLRTCIAADRQMGRCFRQTLWITNE